MKFLIVFNHPYEGSYCNAIMNSVIVGIEKRGDTAEIINLDKDRFNPVVTKEFLNSYRNGIINDPDVLKYQEKIKTSDYLVFIYPIWWEAMPALMKGWIDKIITKGFAFDVDKSGSFPKFYPLLNHLKGVILITTMDSPGILYRLLFGNAVKKIFLNGTFRKIGVKNTKWISFDRINSVTDKKRKERLNYVEKYFYSLG